MCKQTSLQGLPDYVAGWKQKVKLEDSSKLDAAQECPLIALKESLTAFARRDMPVVKATTVLKLRLRLGSYFCHKMHSSFSQSFMIYFWSTQEQISDSLSPQEEKKTGGEGKPHSIRSAFFGVVLFLRITISFT